MFNQYLKTIPASPQAIRSARLRNRHIDKIYTDVLGGQANAKSSFSILRFGLYE